MTPLHIAKVRPGDMLQADGSWPDGDPIEVGARGLVALDGGYLVWKHPNGLDIDLPTDSGGNIVGFVRTPLEAAWPTSPSIRP